MADEGDHPVGMIVEEGLDASRTDEVGLVAINRRDVGGGHTLEVAGFIEAGAQVKFAFDQLDQVLRGPTEQRVVEGVHAGLAGGAEGLTMFVTHGFGGHNDYIAESLVD